MSDQAEFLAFVRRILAAASRRVARSDPEDLAALLGLRDAVDAAIDRAAVALHDEGRSWGEIGRACGITRQAARQRWADNAELSQDRP
jgi:hypothetical protein